MTTPQKKVTYAEQVIASESLNNAPNSSSFSSKHHSPPNNISPLSSSSNPTKGKAVERAPPIIDQVARDLIKKLTADVTTVVNKLAAVQSEFKQMQNRLDSIDNKLDKIISYCTITTDPAQAPSAPVPVNINTNPLLTTPPRRTSPPGFERTFDQPPYFTPSPTIQAPDASTSSNNAISQHEFSSAMGRVEQLGGDVSTITSQLTALTKLLGGDNSF